MSFPVGCKCAGGVGKDRGDQLPPPGYASGLGPAVSTVAAASLVPGFPGTGSDTPFCDTQSKDRRTEGHVPPAAAVGRFLDPSLKCRFIAFWLYGCFFEGASPLAPQPARPTSQHPPPLVSGSLTLCRAGGAF